MTATGLHLDAAVVRAVRRVDGVVAARAEEACARDGPPAALVDACLRAAATVGARTDEPLRVAWSPARIELIHVADAHAAALARTIRMLAGRGATAWTTSPPPDTSPTSGTPTRRPTVAVGIAWDHAATQALAAELRAAGFGDVAIEPAALAARRAPGRPTRAGRRSAFDAADGAALGATLRSAPVRAIRPRTIAVPDAQWVLERIEPAAPPTAPTGWAARLVARLGRIRSARCAC